MWMKQSNPATRLRLVDKIDNNLLIENSNPCVTITGKPGSAGQARGELRFFSSEEIDEYDEDTVIAIDGRIDPKYIVQLGGVAGILTRQGGMTSHGVVIARELDIPCVCGVQDRMDQLEEGMSLWINGNTGEIEVNDG
jgi:pyruvate,water dikinase